MGVACQELVKIVLNLKKLTTLLAFLANSKKNVFQHWKEVGVVSQKLKRIGVASKKFLLHFKKLSNLLDFPVDSK